MAKKKKYTSKERSIWKKGFFAGLLKRRKKKTFSKSKIRSKRKKLKSYTFAAFNENADVFNVEAVGSSKKEALANARKHLKFDPEVPDWKVTITDDIGSSENYRKITVFDTGKIHDNWVPYYRR